MKLSSIAPCLLLSLAIRAGFLQPAYAQTAPLNPPKPIAVPALPKWMQTLQLTPDQIKQVKAVENKYKVPITEDHKKLNQAEETLEGLIVSGAPESQIRDQHKQVQQLRQQFDNARFEVMLKLKDILTKEQRQKLATMNRQRLANLKNAIQGK
ncbi:MAG: Spy/CpxP family protein refolding chaperone [Aphanocapsa sp. GSE-SYN-MK-11-07L]|jgi:Spy/CpxP family protein refolding chaperone|nr:Spy/CpxP family protein refolding chaperone [Aphanocapsa sp. GSE-SYN-MK-11-07L]